MLTFPLLLLIPFALLRLVPGRARMDRAWDWRIDPALTLVCGVGLGTAWGFWLARYHLFGEVVTAADFQGYCGSVSALRGDHAPYLMYWYPMRSLASGLLPSLLARSMGILDGLAAGALISGMVVAGGLYLWGRALGGRLSGVTAAVAGGAVAPLVLTTRLVSFYPEITAALTLSAAGAALALRFRTWPAIAAGSTGAALALLADTRGLIWALPALGLTAVAVALPPRTRLLYRILALFLPLVLSFLLGRVAYGPTAPLEFQLATSANDTSGTVGVMPETGEQEGFRWGHSNPLRIPWTLVAIWKASGQVSEAVSGREVGARNEQAWRQHVRPWLPVAWVCLGLALAGLIRRPVLAAGLIATALPFAVSLRGTTGWEVTLRYLGMTYPMLPVLFGLALSTIVQGRLPRAGSEGESPPSPAPAGGRRTAMALLRPVLAVLILALLVLGTVPSWLSPVAPWRVPWEAHPEAQQTARHVSSGAEGPGTPVFPPCTDGLRMDVERGLDPECGFYRKRAPAPEPAPPPGVDGPSTYPSSSSR